LCLTPLILLACSSASSNKALSEIPEEYREYFETCPGTPSIEFTFDESTGKDVVVGYCQHSGQIFTQFTLINPIQTTPEREQIELPAQDPNTISRDLVYQMIPADGILNSFFELNPKFSPQFAQTIDISDSIDFSSISLFPYELKIAKTDAVFKNNYDYDENDFTTYRSSFTLATSWFVSIYKWEKASKIPDDINLKDGFSLIHEQRTEEIIDVGREFNFRMTPSISLEPGQYLIVFGSIFSEKNMVAMRFSAQQNGDRDKGGIDANSPVDCVYQKIIDENPNSKAYVPDFSALKVGNVVDTWGFSEKFKHGLTKVAECGEIGLYDPETMIWNPGDLQVKFFRNREVQTFKYLSNEPKLPKNSYANMACDPFDPRLKNYLFPDGAGPEARVAAACVALDWIESGVSEKTKLTTYFSNDIPLEVQQRLKDSIFAGERAFGKHGSSDRTYSLLYSIDPEYSCTTGREIMASQKETSANILPQNRNKWDLNNNSGCPEGEYRPGGAEPKNFGSNQQNYFTWTLMEPKDIKLECLDVQCNMMWWVKFINHEYVHSIQLQRTKQQPYGPADPGVWAGEGQAMFYQVQAGELHRGPGDYRAYIMDELIRDMKDANITSIKIEETANYENAWNLPFSAGFFAWEYLIANYGTERSWSWWETWSGRSCKNVGPDSCWREAAPKTFGKSDKQILNEINSYINAQYK
jgi:hypothetical protein